MAFVTLISDCAGKADMLLGRVKHGVFWICCLGLFVLFMILITVNVKRGPSVAAANPAGSIAVIAPRGLVSRAGDQSVILHWNPISSSGLSGYRVYRAAASESRFEPREAALLTTNHFVDFEVDNDHTYHYRVRAVGRRAPTRKPSA